jgi:hypothetical protein
MQRINSPPGDKVKLQQMGMTMNDIPYIVALLTYSQNLCDNYRFWSQCYWKHALECRIRCIYSKYETGTAWKARESNH